MKNFVDRFFKDHPFLSFLVLTFSFGLFSWFFGLSRAGGDSSKLDLLALIATWFQGTLGMAVAFAGAVVALWLAMSALKVSEQAEKRENYRMQFDIITTTFDKLNNIARSLNELYEFFVNTWLMSIRPYFNELKKISEYDANEIAEKNGSKPDAMEVLSDEDRREIFKKIELPSDYQERLRQMLAKLSDAIQNAKDDPYAYSLLQKVYEEKVKGMQDLREERRIWLKKTVYSSWYRFMLFFENLGNWDSNRITADIQNLEINLYQSAGAAQCAETRSGISIYEEIAKDERALNDPLSIKANILVFVGCLLGNDFKSNRFVPTHGLRFLEDMIVMLSNLDEEKVLDIMITMRGFAPLEEKEGILKEHFKKLFAKNNPHMIIKETLWKHYEYIKKIEEEANPIQENNQMYPVFREFVLLIKPYIFMLNEIQEILKSQGKGNPDFDSLLAQAKISDEAFIESLNKKGIELDQISEMYSNVSPKHNSF